MALGHASPPVDFISLQYLEPELPDSRGRSSQRCACAPASAADRYSVTPKGRSIFAAPSERSADPSHPPLWRLLVTYARLPGVQSDFKAQSSCFWEARFSGTGRVSKVE